MSRTVQNTVDWAAPIIRYMPITSGTNSEPALTNSNIVQQTILSAPFCWAWNRATKTFNTVAGTQDYSQAMTDFGFIEKATVKSATNQIFEISERVALAEDSKTGRPEFIAAQANDNAGNITFRLMKVPDAVYTVTVTYQKKSPQITSLSGSWALPDEFQFIANYGFLSLALLHVDDPRLTLYNQKFVASLLSVNRGLSDMERNIFLGNWMALTRQEMNEQIKSQQGNQARGV